MVGPKGFEGWRLWSCLLLVLAGEIGLVQAEDGLPAAAVVGIVMGVLIGSVFIFCCVFWWWSTFIRNNQNRAGVNMGVRRYPATAGPNVFVTTTDPSVTGAGTGAFYPGQAYPYYPGAVHHHHGVHGVSHGGGWNHSHHDDDGWGGGGGGGHDYGGGGGGGGWDSGGGGGGGGGCDSGGGGGGGGDSGGGGGCD